MTKTHKLLTGKYIIYHEDVRDETLDGCSNAYDIIRF